MLLAPCLSDNSKQTPEHSLFSQSKHGAIAPRNLVHLDHLHEVCNFLERNHQLNADGHGLAFFVEDMERPGHYLVGQLRSVAPIFNSESLKSLSQVIWSRRLMAHVRATSGSAVSEANCHPFVFGANSGCPISFMHNGAVAHFGSVRRDMLQELNEETYCQIRGTTDSEVLAAICFQFLSTSFGVQSYSGVHLVAALVHCVGSVIRHVDRVAEKRGWKNISSSLNLAICSPRAVAVCRFRNSPQDPPTLYYQTGSAVRTGPCEKMRRMASSASFRLQETDVYEPTLASHLLVASEPHLNKGTWHILPRNTALLYDETDHCVELLDVDIPRFRVRTALRQACARIRNKREAQNLHLNITT